MNPNPPSYYITGGTMQTNAPSYVTRLADDELYTSLKEGLFCYVLTSRQMGKSSLMIRTRERLQKSDFATVVLDLTGLGRNLSVEQWYDGILIEIGRQLDLEDELEDFWLQNERIGCLQRWLSALRTVVLPNQTKRLVIFIDEIDYVRSLPFSTDEFFAGIRELYNERSQNAELLKLNFCLLGVASPSDLINDTRTTPFNIGKRIELLDFTMPEAAPLIEGLNCDETTGHNLMKRILYWTGGHPYLTQKVCQLISTDGSVKTEQSVDSLCEELFFSSQSKEKDDNLIFVRERILRSDVDKAGLLYLYLKIYQGEKVKDDNTDTLVNTLHLAGIVRSEKGYLVARNRIYKKNFDKDWVMDNLPDNELKRQREAYWAGVRKTIFISAGISVFVIFLVSMIIAIMNSRIESEKLNVEKGKLQKQIDDLEQKRMELENEIKANNFKYFKEAQKLKIELEEIKQTPK